MTMIATHGLTPAPPEMSIADTRSVAEAMFKSGYFPDLRSAEQALVKITAGREFGIGPWASVSQIQIVQGRPTLGANLLGALVKRSARYDYKVLRSDDEACEIEVTDCGKSCGPAVSYAMADAEKAGLTGKDNWKKYPSDMLFARAITRAVRRYCPDVTAGIPAYTPEELEPVRTEAQVVSVGELQTETAASQPAPEVIVPAEVNSTRAQKLELYRGMLQAANMSVNPNNDATIALGISKRVAVLWEDVCKAAGHEPTLDQLSIEQVAAAAKAVSLHIQNKVKKGATADGNE